MRESQKTMSEITLSIRTFRIFGLSLKQRFQEYLMPRLNSEALQPFIFFFFFSVVLLAHFFLFRIFWNNVTPSISPLPLSVASSLLFADSWHLSLGYIVLNLKLPEENVRPDVFIRHHAAQYGVCVCMILSKLRARRLSMIWMSMYQYICLYFSRLLFKATYTK